jgi:hypothetical protein
MSAPQALAGNFEISLGFSFSNSVYNSEGNYSWTRRLGGSVGYEFNEKSEVEFAYQDLTDRTYIKGYEDTTFVDRVYSVNWVQSLLGKNSMFQPYGKVGLGQLNRDATGTYGDGTSAPPSQVDAVTGVLGAGFRLYFTRTIAFRGEATSYLTGGSISTWQDNWSTSLGLSLVF